MNEQTEKRVKSPKGCKGGENTVTKSENAACVHLPGPFIRDIEALKEFRALTSNGGKSPKGCKGCKSRIRPIIAGNETCDKFEKREDAAPYQIFLRVQDSRLLPEIVARPAGEESYPADHVKICGLTVTSPYDGWDIAKAICSAVEDRQDAVRQDEIGQAVLDACNMLHDVCTLNESLSSKSAVELVTGAKRIMEQIAGRLQLPLDYE